MRAAVIQMRSGIDRSRNLEDAEKLIREAAEDGAQLILTPEMTTLLDRNRDRLMASLIEPRPDEEDFFAELSREVGATLIIGSVPVLGQQKVANRSMVFSEGRKIATYDKIHLFDVDLDTGESWRESNLYQEGKEAVLVEGIGAKVGLSICYDLRFPHLYRRLAQAGAEVLTVPAAFTVPTGEAHWEVLLRARAIETGSFVLAAAQGGEHEDGRHTFGHSMIVDPWGSVLDKLSHDSPGVAMADLDLAKVRDVRSRIPSLVLERSPAIRTYRA
ncbi:carbon-nitrogen hydrolase family protein [Parvularcula lutaonensis]|uniref:Carbon-nitrogen hydrolase family protein n=1 Tax=Parvularcula lutaonensis TaxID=491923 RepID=A0ABV7MBC0_9PROT|nr:carbon-nitrogen hydrolase family protein [Parvularcula lutaonensis]GGY39661.1 amidohydrolase [Parvularcula lutaonensis]